MKLISQGEEDVKAGRLKSQEDVFANVEDILTKRMK